MHSNYEATDFYPGENSWSITDASGAELASGGPADGLFGGCVSGCSDTLAENYNADADIVDDSLCEYALVQGCMDASACNYDAAAEQALEYCLEARGHRTRAPRLPRICAPGPVVLRMRIRTCTRKRSWHRQTGRKLRAVRAPYTRS